MTVKELRQQSKKTAAEVAEVLGVTVRAVYQYEQGMRSISLEQVLTLSKLYDVSTEEMITAQLKSNNRSTQ